MNRAFRVGSLALRTLPVLLLLIFASDPALCDEPGSPSNFRFRGAPGSVTRNFLITEFGVAQLLDANAYFPEVHLTWDLGFMHNFGARMALGGTVYLSFKDDYGTIILLGLQPRFRYWPGGQVHLDASAGLLLKDIGEDVYNTSTFPTLIAHAGVGCGDWISLVLQYEEVRVGPWYDVDSPASHTHRWYVGLTSGSYIGAIVGPVVMLGVVMIQGVARD